MAVQQVGERVARDAKGLSRRSCRKTKRLEALLPDNFAGVRGIVHLHLAISPFWRLKGWPNMKSAFRTGYRRPRESGGPEPAPRLEQAGHRRCPAAPRSPHSR